MAASAAGSSISVGTTVAGRATSVTGRRWRPPVVAGVVQRLEHVDEVDHAHDVVLLVEHGVAGVPTLHRVDAPRRAGCRGPCTSTRERGTSAWPTGRCGKSSIRSSRPGSARAAARRASRETVTMRRRSCEVGGVLDVVHRLDAQHLEQRVGGGVEDPDQPAERRQVEQRRARAAAGRPGTGGRWRGSWGTARRRASARTVETTSTSSRCRPGCRWRWAPPRRRAASPMAVPSTGSAT